MKVTGSNPVARSKIMQRQRVVKFVAQVESERKDWGFLVTHKGLNLVASGATETEALEKMDKEISKAVEAGLVHGSLKLAKPAKVGK